MMTTRATALTRSTAFKTLIAALLVALIAAGCSSDDPTSADGAVSGDLSAATGSTAEPETAPDTDATAVDEGGDAADGSDDDQSAPAETPSDTAVEVEDVPVETSDDDPAAVETDDTSASGYEPFQDPTPLPVDPEVVIGTLDNGLTYYLRHNEKPGQNLELRLTVRVGAVNETDEQAGIAHFIEHMLFNGTDEYPGNSLGETLREIGIELGPDVNAYVGQDETVFEMSVATDDPDNVPLAFGALSQMAGAATFESEAVKSEVGIVLDEIRLGRASVDGFIQTEFDRIYTEGTPYEGHDPLGTVETVESFTSEMLHAFYDKWYVPSNMAVIAVGDRTVEDLQALVEDHFGDLPPGETPERIDVTVLPNAASATHVVTDARHGYSYISLDIPIRPHDPGSVGGDRLNTVEYLIEVIVNNRLTDAYHRGELSQVDPPHFGSFTYNRGLRYYGTNWRGDNLDTAFTDYLSVLLTAAEHGFTVADLQRAAAQIRAGLQLLLDRAPSTQDSQHAERYLSHFLYGADISTIDDYVERISALLDEIGTQELTDHFRWQMDQAGVVVIAVGSDPANVPSVAELDAAVAAAAAGPPPPENAVLERLMEVPEPADPQAEGPLEILDAYQWEFANGATVVFVASDIAEGIVNLQASALGGWSRLQPGDRAVSRTAADAVSGSGVGDLSRAELSRFLEDRNVAVSAFIGEASEGFSATSSSDHTETMFQLIHLLVTAPRVDEQSFAEAADLAEIRRSLAETDPDWLAWVAYNEARYGDTWHRPVATAEQIESLSAEQLLDMYRSRLGDVDDLMVAVVGDTDVSVVQRLARHYIGTLPAGEPDTYIDRRPAMVDDLVRRQVDLEPGESAVLEIYHESYQPITPQGEVTAALLATALSERLFLLVREELGASYSAAAYIDTLTRPSPAYDSYIYVTLDPQRFDEIYATVESILDDVARNGISAEEFAQASAILAVDYDQTDNGDLLGALLSLQYGEPEDVLTPERRNEVLEGITPEDVRSLAADLYDSSRRIEIIRRP